MLPFIRVCKYQPAVTGVKPSGNYRETKVCAYGYQASMGTARIIVTAIVGLTRFYGYQETKTEQKELYRV